MSKNDIAASIGLDEFAKRLYDALVDAGISQSELARRSGIGRDSISKYVAALNKPQPENLKKIADALNIEAESLYPNYRTTMTETAKPEQQFRVMPDDPDFMWVRLNAKMTRKKATAIFKIINDD